MFFSDILLKAMTAIMTTSMTLPFGFTAFPNINLQLPDQSVAQGPGIKAFASCSALKTQIAKAGSTHGDYMMRDLAVTAMPTAMAPSAGAAQKSSEASVDYSQTNVQVAGVDEGDIVKQDGTYVYYLSKNRLEISKITPADKAALLSSTDMDKDVSVQGMYLDGDKLMVIGNRYENQVYPMPLTAKITSNVMGIMPPWRGQSMTVAQVWDVVDRTAPKKIRTVEFDGSLTSSRMIGGMVYFVMNSSSPWDDTSLLPSEKDLVPAYSDSQAGKDFKPMVRCTDVAYFDQQPTREYLAVASLPISGKGEIKRDVILGSSQTVYASTENLYAARQDYNYQPIRDSLDPDTQASERTVIYKFAFSQGAIQYQAKGTVPGHLLNQFSLDETDGNLRAATTIGWAWDHVKPSTNNIYVLGTDMKQRGKIEGIAPGETIYSVRFMGKRGYMVTFKKVDPFFVFDLSNPDAPKILGKLKIPGFSDYLHPMDENHIIGVGKNAVDAAEQSFAWYQGMKIAVFDVTDVNNPKQMWQTEIGDRGTDSPALLDHKAFLYSPDKHLLALPIRLAELSADVKADPSHQDNEYGSFTFQGAYVYRLTLDKGFELLGKITHHDNDDAALKSGDFWGQYDTDIQRILYAGDSLVTLSDAKLELHHLYDLGKQGQVDYPKTDNPEPDGGIMY